MRRFSFLILLIPFFSSAQFRNNIWCFGDSAGIDFNSGPLPIISGINSRGSCATISDNNGSLQFITAGCPEIVQIGNMLSGKIYDKTSQIMQGGDSIVTGAWYNEQIIIPNPGDSNLFYVFTAGVTGIHGLYYSLVDLSQNGGFGLVTQKNIQLQSFTIFDCLTATKHGNGRDWWLFFRQHYNGGSSNNEFHSYLITPAGITNYTVQNVGSPSYTNLGKLVFSSNGNRAAFVTYAGLLEVYDFDRCSGVLSNPIGVFQETINPPFNHFWGAEFSPNGNVLYVTISDQTSYLFQFDLTAANIAVSIDTLWQTSYPGEAIGGLKRGPDNRIYESGPYTNPAWFVYPYPDSVYNMYNMNLGVINSPDSLGSVCNFQPYSFYLSGKRTYWGLPNNPNYDLVALSGSICDTLATSVKENWSFEEKTDLSIFYHPEWQTAFINANGLKGKNYSLHLVNLEGKELIVESGKLNSGFFTKDLSCAQLSSGIYLVLFETEKDRLVKKFLIEK